MSYHNVALTIQQVNIIWFIFKSKDKFKLNGKVRIVSCYKAGRDGFCLDRYLLDCGIENIVVDSSSIEVNRRKRRTKTDRVDARKLS